MRNLIVIISIVIVAATIGTMIVGSRTFDGVVVERPYEAGLAWDETQKQQARLAWRIAVDADGIKVGRNEIVLRLSNRDGSPLDGASVDVTLSRPSTRDYDHKYVAKPLGGGRYQVSTDIPLAGWWDLRTVAARSADTFTAIERIEARE